MTLKDSIAHRITALCAERGLNPGNLSHLCGIDRSTIYSILGNKSKSPEVATIKKICGGLEMTLGNFSPVPNLTGWNRKSSEPQRAPCDGKTANFKAEVLILRFYKIIWAFTRYLFCRINSCHQLNAQPEAAGKGLKLLSSSRPVAKILSDWSRP